MRPIAFTRAALRELVSEAMEGHGLDAGPTRPTAPVEPNSVVDPTTAVDGPGGASYLPKDKAEFAVALGRLTQDLGDEDVPGLYKQVQAALQAIGDNDGDDEGRMRGIKMAGTTNEDTHRGAKGQIRSDSASRAGAPCPWGRCSGKLVNGRCDKCGTPDPYARRDKGAQISKDNLKIEEAVRRAVRRMIAEAMPGRDLGYSGPDTYALSAFDDEPFKVYGFTPKGTRKAQPDASFDTRRAADDWMARLKKQDPRARYEVVDESPEDDEPEREKGKWSVPKGDDGQEFGDISKELGMSVMGAQAMAARAMRRFGHMHKMMFGDLSGEGAMPEEAQLVILTAARDFIESLNDDRKAQKILALLTGRDMKELLPDSVAEYARYLEGSGELAGADVQLLKDHPGMVAELDGYPEFVRTQLLADLETELAQLPNDLDTLTGLDAFREFLSGYVQKSYRDWSEDAEDE